MRRSVVCALLLVAVLGGVAGVGAAEPELTIAQELENESGTVTVIVHVNDRHPIVPAGVDKEEELKATAHESQQEVKALASSRPGIEVVKSFWITNAVLVKIDTEQVPIERLVQLDSVQRVEPNNMIHREPITSSSSTDFDGTWGLDAVGAREAWEEYGTQGEGTKVAVLDTGVEPDHPDIDLYRDNPQDSYYKGGWVEYTYDPFGGEVYKEDSKPYDADSENQHGTHTSGTATGQPGLDDHIGVAPGADLLHASVLNIETDSGMAGTTGQIISGMEWAVDQNADVISMSLGGSEFNEDYADAIQNAEAAGSVVVASSGNDGEDTHGSPGDVYDAISVGAHDIDGEITWYSSGATIDTSDWDSSADTSGWPSEYIVPTVSAPGDYVSSAALDSNGNYVREKYRGTSMAAPHVAGAAALLRSKYDLTPDEVERALIVSSVNPTNDNLDTRYGHGMIDIPAAMEWAKTQPKLSGYVLDRNGDPISSANVVIAQELQDTTAADGSYAIPAAANHTYRVNITGTPDHLRSTYEISTRSTLQQNITLKGALSTLTSSLSSTMLAYNTTSTFTFDVEYVENVTVDSTFSGEFEVGNTEHTFGQFHRHNERITTGSYGITITTAEPGTHELNVTFTHNGTVNSLKIPVEVVEPTAYLPDGSPVNSVTIGAQTYSVSSDVTGKYGLTAGSIPQSGEITVNTDSPTAVTIRPGLSYENVTVTVDGQPYENYTYDGSTLVLQDADSDTTYSYEFVDASTTSNNDNDSTVVISAPDSGSDGAVDDATTFLDQIPDVALVLVFGVGLYGVFRVSPTRFLPVVVVLVMVVAIVSVPVAEVTAQSDPFAGGSGIKDDPYQIETCDQLQSIDSYSASHFELIQIVDCSGYDFSGITNFTGELDGNYLAIKGLEITEPDSSAYFITTGSQSSLDGAADSIIERLRLTDIHIESTGSDEVYDDAAPFNLRDGDASVTEVHVNGTIISENATAYTFSKQPPTYDRSNSFTVNISGGDGVTYGDSGQEIDGYPELDWQNNTIPFVTAIKKGTNEVKEGFETNTTVNIGNHNATQITDTIRINIQHRNETQSTWEEVQTPQEDVTIDSLSTKTIDIAWTPEHRGEYRIFGYVNAEYDINIDRDALFNMTSIDPETTAIAGNQHKVPYTVTNEGNRSHTQDIDLIADGIVVNRTGIELDGNETVSGVLSWEPMSTGTYNLKLQSDDTETTDTVDVQSAPPFTVSSVTAVNGTESETLDVNTTIKNDGSAEDTQTVTLTVDGTEYDSQNVTLAAGEQTDLTFMWDPPSAGSYTATIDTPDDSGSDSVTVYEETIEVEPIPDYPDTQLGDSLDINVTVTNTGGTEHTDTVTVTAGGTTVLDQSVTLAAGANQTLSTTWTPDSSGDYTISAATGANTETASVTVVDPPAMNVSLDIPEFKQYDPGSRINVTINVTNTGGPGTDTLSIYRDGEWITELSVSLDSGETGSLDVSIETGQDDFTLNVTSSTDSTITDVSVGESLLVGSNDGQTNLLLWGVGLVLLVGGGYLSGKRLA